MEVAMPSCQFGLIRISTCSGLISLDNISCRAPNMTRGRIHSDRNPAVIALCNRPEPWKTNCCLACPNRLELPAAKIINAVEPAMSINKILTGIYSSSRHHLHGLAPVFPGEKSLFFRSEERRVGKRVGLSGRGMYHT